MRGLTGTLTSVGRDVRGATAIEYALVASLISVAAIMSFETLGTTVDNRYQTVDKALDGTI